jgi:hypothetical protein
MITVITGLDPVIHASIGANPGGGGRVDAHGTSPWAEGPRIKSGHDDRRVVKTLQDAPRPWMTAN